jgi:hypothetical protein
MNTMLKCAQYVLDYDWSYQGAVMAKQKKFKLSFDEINEIFSKHDPLLMSHEAINRSTAQFGKILSPETKEKISHALKGSALMIVTCPHCGK